MSRTVRYEMPYEAPIDAVAAMLGDPAFREEVCAAQHYPTYSVEIVHNGETKHVHIEQTRPTEGLPAIATKVVGKQTQLVQDESWASPTVGDVVVTIPGKPGTMSGTARLTEQRDGSTLEVVELTVNVSIPLVGGKLENLIGDLLLKALKYEHRTGQAYLARQDG